MAQRIGRPARLDHVPGIWKYLQQRNIDEIRRGDARGFGLPPEKQAAISDHPNSTVSAARAALAGMDRGDPVVTWPPTARQFPAVADIPWLADRTARRIWVFPDDSVLPYKE